jgi:demethylmenaquinone methyltransferase/2-methoxy-6-polyprenyl-1,4-benzoquinol methylase
VARSELFLCTGNYYRSRFAEHLFNARARERGLDWRAESAGLAPRCWTRNQGPISPAVVRALASRGVVVGETPRLPRDVTEALVGSAERVVLLSERDHRGLFEERFPAVSARVSYWDIDDVDRCPPEVALPRIEELVETLLGELESLPPTVREVAAYYAARAPVYDLTAGYLDRAGEALRAPIKRRLQALLEGHDVLEIACGTGYWTEVIAMAARSVVATDVNPAMIALAEARLRGTRNVELVVNDAYSLPHLGRRFSAAAAVWWWSHMPKARIREFLGSLHRQLLPGARVLFVDQLPDAYQAEGRHRAKTGDIVEMRTLPDGRTFRVIKNFPTDAEIRELLGDRAEDVNYREYPAEQSWWLSYTWTRTKP